MAHGYHLRDHHAGNICIFNRCIPNVTAGPHYARVAGQPLNTVNINHKQKNVCYL